MSAIPHPSYPLAAYTERDSIDPLTCEEGKLRREWAVVPAAPLPADLTHLSTGFHGHEWGEYALICRYNRRGTIEPWAIFGLYPSEGAALRDIGDSSVVAVDIRLMTIQREREWARRTEEARLAAESEKARERERTRTLRLAGNKAFEKLIKGGKPADLALCERWNDFNSSPASIDRRDLYAADPTFMSLYYAALYADRLPAKRKAMREFFAYVGARTIPTISPTPPPKRSPQMSSIGVFSYPNQERSEAKKGTCISTDIHPNKLTAIAFAEKKRQEGYSCRVYERPLKADNRVMLLAVTVTREQRKGRAK